MDTLRRDLSYALRMLWKSPAVTLIAVLSLSLGIGANTALFSIIDGMLLRPLPYRQPERLVAMWTMLPRWGREAASAPDFQDWRKVEALQDAAAVSRKSVNLGEVSEPQHLVAGRITANYFSVLGLSPVIGRTFTPAEDQPGGANVLMLGRTLWQRQFGGRADVLGRTVQLNGVSYEVIGVAPSEMNVVTEADLWVPAALPPDAPRRGDFLRVVGRLKDGATVEQAQAQLSALARELSDRYPNTNKDVGVQVVELHSDLVRNARPMLLSLWAAVGFVLLIVIANVANLLLARGAARTKEMAIRVALGAKPARLARQLLTESVVLAAMGGAAGLALSYWALDAAVKFLPWQMPEGVSLQISSATMWFALVTTLGAGILFGILPALHAGRASVFAFLKEGGRSSQSSRQGARRVLAAAEIALSLLLLVGAGLMIRTMQRLQNVDPGFRGDGVLTFSIGLPATQYTREKQVIFYDQLLARLASLPQVQSVAATSGPYFQGGNYLSFNIQGRPPKPGDEPDAYTSVVSPDYLRTLGIQLDRGRNFTQQDRMGTQRVALVNQKLARQHFAGEDPIGKSISFDGKTWLQIVGVISDVRQESLDKPSYPEVLVPLAQLPTPYSAMVLKTNSRPEALVPAARAAVHALDPNVPLYKIHTMAEWTEDSLSDRSFQTWLLGGFAGLALLLAAIGIYGVMAQAVAQRTSEFGIRMALGAQPGQILGMVLRNALRLVALGVAAGLVGSLILTRFLRSFLYGVSSYDPITIGAVCALLVGVALLACYLPARRAMAVDPMVALRYE